MGKRHTLRDHSIRFLVLILLFQVSVLALIAPAGAQQAPVLDGKKDGELYETQTLEYTQDNNDRWNGLIAVYETADAYYIYFEQAANAKSNTYCAKKEEPEECYQEFGALVGSDHITFEWTLNGEEVVIPVDIISENETSTQTPSGFIGRDGTGDGGDVEGIPDSAVDARSGMDYNMNVFGWTNEDDSPNFAGQPDCKSPTLCYIYASTAEVRIDKAGAGLGNGLAATLRQANVITHNSPAAPTVTQPSRFIVCEGSTDGVAPGDAKFNVFVTENGSAKPSAPVLVEKLSTEAGITVVSVGGTAGNKGTTGGNGRAEVVVRSNNAGTGLFRAIVDVDNDGVWDQVSEPSTECSANWTQPPGPEIDIIKDGPQESKVGETIIYELTVSIPIDRPLHDVVVTDPNCDSAPTLETKTGGNQDDILEFGETWFYTCPHQVRASDPNPLPNTASVSGLDDLDQPATDDDSHLVVIVPQPNIKIKKDGPQRANVGDKITYVMEVTIPIDRPLHNVEVTDPKCDSKPKLDSKDGGDNDDLLELNEVWTFTCKHTVTVQDIGTLRNTATAEGVDEDGEKVKDKDDHNVIIEDVQGERIDLPPQPPDEVLPFTGMEVDQWLTTAFLLLICGTGTLLVTRLRTVRARRVKR